MQDGIRVQGSEALETLSLCVCHKHRASQCKCPITHRCAPSVSVPQFNITDTKSTVKDGKRQVSRRVGEARGREKTNWRTVQQSMMIMSHPSSRNSNEEEYSDEVV